VTSAPGTKTKTERQQATITGTDGKIATWTAIRDPDHTDNAQTQTQTDDDGGVILIFPGGWKWISVPGGNKGGPMPTMNPAPGGNGKSDPDNDDDDENCTTTAPPKCTLTMSY
jgi:hypothetical protein